MSRAVTIHHGLRTVVGGVQKARSKLAGDCDQMRRDLQVRFGHLSSRVMTGVGRMRLREVRQITGRERRGDRRHREQQQRERQHSRQTRAMRGADHDDARRNKNPAIVPRCVIFVETSAFRRKFVDHRRLLACEWSRRFCHVRHCCRH